MIAYRATLDVPIDTLRAVTGWLREHRRVHDARPGQRAATVYVQALMVLRWFKEDTDLRILARDAGVSIATAYRYLHKGIDVIADHATDLADVLVQARRPRQPVGVARASEHRPVPTRPSTGTRSLDYRYQAGLRVSFRWLWGAVRHPCGGSNVRRSSRRPRASKSDGPGEFPGPSATESE